MQFGTCTFNQVDQRLCNFRVLSFDVDLPPEAVSRLFDIRPDLRSAADLLNYFKPVHFLYVETPYCLVRVAMSEDVFEKPLVMKDFVRGKKNAKAKKTKKSKLYKKVKSVPESKKQKRRSKYSELINAIAREKEGTYKVLLSSIRPDLTPRSARPSIEKVLIQMAKRDGVDFSITVRRLVQTKRGVRPYVSYPEYLKWREHNLKLRAVNGELFIEKKTRRPL